MSKGSGNTRSSSSRAGASSNVRSNRLSRYDGEEIAAGEQKVSSDVLRGMSDTELYQTEQNVRTSLKVRNAHLTTPETETPTVKRLRDAEKKVSKEITRREDLDAKISKAEERVKRASARYDAAQSAYRMARGDANKSFNASIRAEKAQEAYSKAQEGLRKLKSQRPQE